jgi:hypothetical protein
MRFHQISFHHGIHAQGRDARTEKTAEAYILRVGFFLKILSLGIDPRDFDVNAEPDADFGPGNSVLLLQARQASAQRFEIDGLLKEASGSEFFAIPLGIRGGLATHQENGNRLRLAAGSQSSAQIDARKLGHAQVQQDGVGPVFHCQRQSLLGIARVDDLVAVGQIQAQKAAHRIIIIYDQESFHWFASFLWPDCAHVSCENRNLRERRVALACVKDFTDFSDQFLFGERFVQ